MLSDIILTSVYSNKTHPTKSYFINISSYACNYYLTLSSYITVLTDALTILASIPHVNSLLPSALEVCLPWRITNNKVFHTFIIYALSIYTCTYILEYIIVNSAITYYGVYIQNSKNNYDNNNINIYTSNNIHYRYHNNTYHKTLL